MTHSLFSSERPSITWSDCRNMRDVSPNDADTWTKPVTIRKSDINFFKCNSPFLEAVIILLISI